MRALRPSAGLLVVAAFASVLLAPVAHAQVPAAARVVEGQVVNGTAGGGVVAGLTVVLHKEGSSRHDHLEATTDDEGRFRFAEIDFDPEVTHGVSVTYGEALYGTDLDLSAGSPSSVAITVYEPVHDDAFLTVSNASVLFAQVDKASQTLWALEIMAISNDTDRTYVPGPEPMQILRFGLPPGAQGLLVDTKLMDPRVIQVERGFGLAASVPPGEHEVMYAYRFPYSGDETVFFSSMRYGAESLRVLTPHEIARLSSGRLGPTEDVVIGGRSYQLLSGSDLARGEPISLSITGLPTASLADRTRDRLADVPWKYASPAALALLMASLIALALWRRGFAVPGGLGADVGVQSVEGERSSIVEELARLDRSFQQGAIVEEEYHRRRSTLAVRLAAASKRGPPEP